MASYAAGARLLVLSAAIGFAACAPAQQDYPNRPIRLVVPYPAGGPLDPVARAIGQKLFEVLSQPVVVDFRAGATGSIGADNVAKAAPDGYTLLLIASSFVIAPSLSTKLPFDPIRDFAAVSLTTTGHDLLIVHPGLPAQSVKQLIALARERPGKLTFGSSGTGGPLHLFGELFKSMTATDMLHVPYKGGGPAMADVIGGHVDLMFVGLAAAVPHVKNGKLRALGVASLERVASLPEVPTIIEGGVPGFVANPFTGILAPAATPTAVITKLNAALVQILQTQDIRQRFAAWDVEPRGSTPAQFAAYLREQIAKWAKVVKIAGLKAE